jgi:predicted transcriptional regulator YheO
MAESKGESDIAEHVAVQHREEVRQLDPGTKQAVIEALALFGQVVTQTVGDWCELVVHDLADLEHSIVSISGNVTGRKVGGNITDLGLAKLRAGETEPLVNYASYTDDGKTLKCSSVFFSDETGKPYACVCVNLNVSPVLLFEHFVHDLGSLSQDVNVKESFGRDLTETIETIVSEAAYEAGKTLSVMSKEDRLTMVSALDARGLFQLRHSVPVVAKRLGVSRKTVYNYLSELEAAKS